jgi:hypothetical protein|tara:strand:- start:229 stop:411 length:183 start_codon:yes stop_codon:yes gene_type:complete
MKIRKNIRSQHLMKKIILILITVLFTSNVYAHSTKGVTIGGTHMDEYMPQFMNFFKENLL